VDHFFPSIGGGVPLFHHYQHLPHVSAAFLASSVEALANKFDPNSTVSIPYSAETDGLALVFLCAMPFIIFRSLTAIDFSPSASAVASFMYVAAAANTPCFMLTAWTSFLSFFPYLLARFDSSTPKSSRIFSPVHASRCGSASFSVDQVLNRERHRPTS